MMRQCGAITTNNLDETIDVMKLLSKAKRPTGPRMALARADGRPVGLHHRRIREGRVPGAALQRLHVRGARRVLQHRRRAATRTRSTWPAPSRASMETLDRILRIVDADPNVDGDGDGAFGDVRRAAVEEDAGDSLDKTLDALQAHTDRSAKPLVVVLHPAHEAEYVAQRRAEVPRASDPALPELRTRRGGDEPCTRLLHGPLVRGSGRGGPRLGWSDYRLRLGRYSDVCVPGGRLSVKPPPGFAETSGWPSDPSTVMATGLRSTTA